MHQQQKTQFHWVCIKLQVDNHIGEEDIHVLCPIHKDSAQDLQIGFTQDQDNLGYAQLIHLCHINGTSTAMH